MNKINQTRTRLLQLLLAIPLVLAFTFGPMAASTPDALAPQNGGECVPVGSGNC